MSSKLYRGLTLFLLVAGCGVGTTTGGRRDGGTGAADLSASIDGYIPGGPCDTNKPCPMGQRCLSGMCIKDNGTCTSDNDCQNDSYCQCTGGGGGPDMGACMGGVCVPWGAPPRGLFDPECKGQSFSAMDFKPPVVKCSWTQEDVIDTPVVVDLNQDGKPEIVFSTYPSGMLVAIQGSTCVELWRKSLALNNFGQVAAADLDGDKLPEIIATDSQHRVVVLDRNGTVLATASQSYGGSGLGSDCNGPVIVEIDGMAPPEIVVAGQVSRYVKGQGIQVLWTQNATPAQWGHMAVAADLDGDGTPEVVAGLQVYDGKTGAVKTPPGWSQLGGSPGAYAAIADFNKDKKPEVVLVQSTSGNEKVSVWDWAAQKFIFGPMAVTPGWGGPPTVADFDGDGTPDFASAGPSNYFVFALKCWPNGGPGCAGPGILWKKVTHDTSSGGTGSSVFDFNGDGKAEVVYRDECILRVMDGSTGKTVFAKEITSGTCLENPIIADVDNDGHADLIVPSDNVQGNYCAGASDPDTGLTWKTQTQGIFVLQDPMNRWVNSRSIWNQHSYHITNVNDDATVPWPETPNWTTWNNYRANVQGMVMTGMTPQGDFTGGVSSSIDNGGNDCKTSFRLWAQLCNRGTAVVNAGVPATFYTDDPRKVGAMKICSTATKMTLQPGSCEAVYCDWANPPSGSVDVWFRANDDGSKYPFGAECKNDNDYLFMPGISCFIPG